MCSLQGVLALPVWLLLTSVATDFSSSRLKQYFVALTDCLSHLSVVLSCCSPQSLSWLLSYFHFSAFNISGHCFLPRLICFFWAFLILLGFFQLVCCLEVAQLSVWDTSVHHYKPLFPGRLEEQHSPVSDVLLQWSSPFNSTAECGLAWELHPDYSCSQTAL